jgi:dCMP deaminase
VLHAGYEALFDRHPDAAEVLLLGPSFAEEYPVLRKEIRALPAAVAARYLSPRFATRVVELGDLPAAVTAEVLVVPDEELMRAVIARFGLDERVSWERTFLRWDRDWSQAQRPADYDGTVGVDELGFMAKALQEAGFSSDWWRQVGAVAVRDGSVLGIAHNEHRPTEYAPYLNGDPRNDFSRGVRADLSTALHAEAALVARAARDGLGLAAADLYVSTFPCPACARLIAEAGFARCFFAGPYALLDGDTVLRAAQVELIWIDVGAGD